MKKNSFLQYRVVFQLIMLLILGIPAQGQEILQVEDAVKIALENNYEIRISANNLKIDQRNVALGNAGMLPKVEASIIDNNSIQNSSQTRSDGTVNELDNAKNNSLNYGVALNWTVFDGFRMFARYDQLKELQKLSEADLQLTVLTKVSDVLATYYDLAQQQQQLKALDTTIVISEQRVALAHNRFTIGKASKLEVLNAQVDLNSDQTLRLRQQEMYANTKIRLNVILARDTKTNFSVADEIQIDNQLLLPELESLAGKQNPQMQMQLINQRIAELELKQVKALRYPTISVNTGYNFAESESSLGFTSQASSQGFNYGFRATLNLFDGLNQNRNEKNSKLLIENSKIAIAQQNQTLISQLGIFYQTYLTNVMLISIEEKNQAIAKENLDITLEKFRIGTITTLEFRAAQLNYINAKVRFSNTQYQAKLSEITLKELAGNLTF